MLATAYSGITAPKEAWKWLHTEIIDVDYDAQSGVAVLGFCLLNEPDQLPKTISLLDENGYFVWTA